MNSAAPSTAESRLPPSRLLSYLRLGRLPNVFTAFADVAMGYLVTRDEPVAPVPFALLLLASGCLYTAGMVLNDVFDVDVDRVERPERPLPSGQIDVGWARRLGLGLLLVGVGCGGLLALVAPAAGALTWRPLVLAAAIAGAVLAYDGGVKRTVFGPLSMGLCRFLNVLLGMSLGTAAAAGPATLYYSSAELVIAAGIGVYITGVTWFARTEATDSSRLALAAATLVMASGIVILAALPEFLGPRPLKLANDLWWPALLGMLFVTILRNAVSALADPQPPRVQATIKHAIMSLILFDAAVVLVLRGPLPAICVLALIVPLRLLGRWVYST